jgi:hypothetical protein
MMDYLTIMIRTLAFCLLPACALFIGDLGHIQSGMAVYPGDQGPRLGAVPLWVFGEFYLAALVLVATYSFKAKILKFKDPNTKVSFVLFNLLWTLIIYLGTSLPEKYFYAKFFGLALMVLAQLIYLKMTDLPSIADLLLVMTCGWATEYVLGQSHIFVYLPNPSIIFTLPAWLPLIYASAAMTARVGGKYLAKT